MMNRSWTLIVGDVICIAVLTLIGFASHREAELSFLPRMAALFFPLCIAWFLLAGASGLLTVEATSGRSQIWRAGIAALFAAPFAAILRGFLLNAPVIPIFGAVLAGTTALGMTIWRTFYYFWNRRAS
jgi:uncharacterized integral membrane protein